MSINLTTTHTKHKPIYIYTHRQKPLKLLKIKKGPIDKTFHKTSGFDSWQRITNSQPTIVRKFQLNSFA